MDKVTPTSCNDIIQYIDKMSCGAVYPLSIAEMNQNGDIYTGENSALFWHYSGFAFLYGACDNNFLNCVYNNFLSIDSSTSRRFILFVTNEKVRQYFLSKDNIVSEKRYFFEYTNSSLPKTTILSEDFKICEINKELFDKIQGTVTPRFSWINSSEFLNNGKGYCVVYEETVAAWAFSAAISTYEIDIGIETRTEYQHLGLGTIVAKKMIQHCFEQHKRPVWACHSKNIASQKLAEKIGFVKISECDTLKNAKF